MPVYVNIFTITDKVEITTIVQSQLPISTCKMILVTVLKILKG